MSVVPYRASDPGQIVYHDPTSQVLVVHNYSDNSVELYGSHGRDSEESARLFSSLLGPPSGPRRKFSPVSDPPCCPSCGTNLTDYLHQWGVPQAHFRSRRGRESHRNTDRREFSEKYAGESHGSKGLSDISTFLAPDFTTTHFINRDYFRLLAELPYGAELAHKSRALEAPVPSNTKAESPFTDLFNQGYFERFFQKVPPKILGSGAHAQVYKVVHVLKGIELGVFAVKRINVGDHMSFLDQVLNEVLILYELSAAGAGEHNLIRYNHVWMEYGDLRDSKTYILDPGSGPAYSENVPYVYILQQYCDGGHLEHLVTTHFPKDANMSMKQKVDAERARRRDRKGEYLSKNHKQWLCDIEIWKFFSDIVNAVAYLHKHGILHRDLKPSNCLLETRYDPDFVSPTQAIFSDSELASVVAQLPKVLVSDFGEGKFLYKKQKRTSLFEDGDRRGNTGTLEFTDPKLWLLDGSENPTSKPRFSHQFDYSSDIYSLGMILCFLCTGTLPFAGEISDYRNPEAVRQDIAQWHSSLTAETFHRWYDDKSRELERENSPASKDFRALAYSMIKGEANTDEVSSEMIQDYLHSMKWASFIPQRTRARSEATIVEMSNQSASQTPSGSNSAEKEQNLEEEAGDTTIDLVELVKSEKHQEKATNFGSRQTRKETRKMVLREAILRKTAIVKCLYVLNLATLEKFGGHDQYLWIAFCKLGNAISLAGEHNLCNGYRMYMVSFWTVASVLTLLL